MSNTQISTYDFHNSNIRIATSEDGVILFCLADVCTVLQLANPNHAVNSIKEEFSIPTLNVGMVTRPDGSRIEANFITEPQLYFVMMRSRAKIAREFRQWICNEVLPSIRAQGAFKQGYTIALNKGNPQAHLNTQEQIESGQVRGVLMTESQAVAVDHILYYHQMFKPDLLAIYDQIASLQKQAQDLCFALRDINKARLYEAATAPDFSVDVLLKNKKKNELVTRG